MAFVPVFHQYGMDTLPQFRTQPGQAFGDILMHQTLGKAKGSSGTAHRSAMVNNILPQHQGTVFRIPFMAEITSSENIILF